MNRYSITNKATGRQFEATGDVLPERHPYWGEPAIVKLKARCDEWQLANGTTAGLDDKGNELWNCPDEMQVVTTNIDADLAAEALKKQQARDALQEIRDFDETTATAAQVRQWQRNVKRVLTYVFKSI